MISINVQITGDKELIAKLQRLESQISDFGEALTKIGRGLVDYYENQVFNSQGGVFGERWARLAPGTIAYKKKHYRQYVNVPLMETGTMRDSFEFEAKSQSLEIRNTASYFVYHQSTEPRNKLPRRQMLGINTSIKNTIQKIIKEDIERKIGKL